MYLGGGTTRWVNAFTPMIGRLSWLSMSANSLPPLECSLLWNRSLRHSFGLSSCDRTARNVWWLIVNGLGKQPTRPSG